MPRPAIAERFYRLLLRCYPGEFRDEYEREMLLAFRDRLSHDRGVGAGAILRLFLQLVGDAVFRAPGEHLDVLRQDARYAVRSLRRAPLFALTTIVTLALGVGANTAIFSVVNAVALRPLSYDPERRLIRIWEENTALNITGFAVSVPNYLSWRERSRTLELAAWLDDSVTLRGSGDPVRVPALEVSNGFLPILGITPVRGRLFTAADESAAAAPVALITSGLWKSQFGAAESVVGSPVIVAGTAHTIVGIVPEERMPTTAEFLRPLRMNAGLEDRTDHVARVIGRMAPGITIAQATDELKQIARQLEVEFPEDKGWGVITSSVYDWIVPPATRRALFVLLAAVCCVLLIACANVANLMLARAAGRRREMALRLAIGAGRRRLVRQVLTEGMLLAVAGGALGILLAYWSVPLLKQWLPSTLPRADEASVSPSVLLFSLGLCTVTGFVFAVLPALAGSRTDVVEALKEGARGSSGGSSRWRQMLAAVQVALATVLLVSAGLLLQSAQRLQRVDLGFDPANVTTAMMGLPGDRYQGTNAWGFYARLLERLEASPGVEAAAITSSAPFDGGNTGTPIEAVGPSRLEGKPLQADWRMASPGYFRTLRVPLVAGRLFAGNRAADDRSMIVSASMARRIWGEENPIGRQITAGPTGTFTIIGVVGDIRNRELSLAPAPTMYISTARFLSSTITVVVRVSDPAAQPAVLMRSTVRELDPQLAVFAVRTMPELVGDSAAQPRLNATLVVLFAVVAALLAAVGIYGVLAYLVSQRRQEIGIRVALGAGRAAVLRLFLTRGLWLATAGVGVGIAGAFAVSKWITSLMFGISATDPLTFVAAGLLAAGVAVAASYVPARRATRVDPLVALRSE